METLKRVCVLTGATGMLGRAFIEKYKSTYIIIGTYHNKKIPNAVSLEDYNPDADIGTVYGVHVDLSKMDEVQKLCNMLNVHVGDIDVLINNAAVVYLPIMLSRDAMAAGYHTILVNLLAPFRLSVSLALQGWKDTELNKVRNRNIINISSISGSQAVDDGRYGMYAASKAALDHLTRHMTATFNARSIRANAIAPDTIDSRVPMDTVLEAIISVDGGSMSGQVIPVINS